MTPVESARAVAVRFSPLWEGAAPGDHRARAHARGSGRRAGRHRLRGPRADICQGGELSGRAHDSRRDGRHRPAHRHPGGRGRADRGARARGVLRGHRRARAGDGAGARDGRAAAQALAHLRAARHPRAEGRAAVRPARHRQDAARARRRRGEPRALHSPQRPRHHAEVLRRERGQAPRGVRGSGAPRAGDPLHRRDRRRRAQARRRGRRGREARRGAAPEPDGRLRLARPGHRHRRDEHPGSAGSGAPAARALRSRDRDRRAEHAGPASDPQDPLARHAARARCRPAGARRTFPRLRRRRSRSVVPGNRHDHPAPVPLRRTTIGAAADR